MVIIVFPTGEQQGREQQHEQPAPAEYREARSVGQQVRDGPGEAGRDGGRRRVERVADGVAGRGGRCGVGVARGGEYAVRRVRLGLHRPAQQKHSGDARTHAGTKEGNVLFNDALDTFYLRLYGVGHMVKDRSDSARERKPAAITWATLFN